MSRLSDVLFGIAVADAIGNPLEFQYDVTPKQVAQSASKGSLVVSDDTQMSLFCTEALWGCQGPHEALESLRRGYQNWYYTQRSHEPLIPPGLLSFPCMYSVQAPGRTCIGSLSDLRFGREVKNDSKGNGTVMRCTPISYWGVKQGLTIGEVYDLASHDAQVTHKHPYAARSSMVLAGIHYRLQAGFSLPLSVIQTVNQLKPLLSDDLRYMFLDSLNPGREKELRSSMGGWVAEEALALAISAVVCTETYTQAITRAIALPGRADSDTVGGIAGGLAAACGREVPAVLKAKLNNLPAMDYICDLIES